MKKIEFTTDELKEIMTKLCEVGQEMGYEPDQWTVALHMCAQYLAG